MNISKNWLNEYVKVDCSLDELCRKLTMAGIEVEGLEAAGMIPDGVVVGKILERNCHPNADKLSVCKVSDGKNVLQIVCGAPNCDAGKTIPLATNGTDFGGGFVIKPTKLRGVESFGMMCSAKELGLSEEHGGLLELDDKLEAGTPVAPLFKSDVKIEVEVTPNRPDWLSHWGIARDVSCLFNVEAKLPEIKVPAVANPEKADRLITVEDYKYCPRYIGRIIRNVKVGPSPAWLKERLESIGLRSINNVVDVTNFVLMELGHPLHAFDLDKLSGKRVVARPAKAGETITTLDGKVLKLEPRHVVIADDTKPMALAGIMGGLDSGVTESTVDVLLESAVFWSSNIRATSRELGITSDSSYRFERGVDYDNADLASDRAVQLILEVAGGTLATEKIDVNNGRPAEKVIVCRFQKVRDLIGAEISNAEMVDIFNKLHLKVAKVTAESCEVTAPLFRLDLEREADLTEEVVRIYGLDKIPEIPVTGKVVSSIADDAYLPIEQLRDKLIALGLYECIHYSMVTRETALSDSRFTEVDLVKLANPMSPDLCYMRPSLYGEMLHTLERNISRRNLNLRLFEIDKAFCKNPALFPEERLEICIALTGKKLPERYGAELKSDYDFYDLKGLIESLFELCQVTNYRFVTAGDQRYAADTAMEIVIEGKTAGHFGEVASALTKSWRTTSKVFAAQLDVAALLRAGRGKKLYQGFSQFPSVSRDVAFLCDASLEHAKVLDFIRKCKLANLESVRIFDLFADAKALGEGKKSMAYSLTFRHAERTLTDAEVNGCFEALRDKLAKELKVELR